MLILVGSGVIVYTAVDHLVEGTEIESIGFGIAVVAFATVVNLDRLAVPLPPRRARPTRPRSPATPRTCAPTRSRRSACSSASRWSAITGETWIDPVVALVIAVAIVYTGLQASSPARGACWSTRRCPRTRLAAIRDAIESFGERGVAGYHELRTRRAGPRRYVDIHVQFRSGTTLEDAHAIAHSLQDTIRARLRGADVLIHLEPEDAVRPGEEIGACAATGAAKHPH